MKSTLLLSVHPRFADGILAGTKRVELRRKFPHVPKNAKVFIYETSPTMAIVGSFGIESVVRLELELLWHKFEMWLESHTRSTSSISGDSRLEWESLFRLVFASAGRLAWMNFVEYGRRFIRRKFFGIWIVRLRSRFVRSCATESSSVVLCRQSADHSMPVDDCSSPRCR